MKPDCVIHLKNLKELNIDPSLISITYAKQIFRSPKSKKGQPSNACFAGDNSTTEKLESSKDLFEDLSDTYQNQTTQTK